MNQSEWQTAISSLNEEQFQALRICIMAERRMHQLQPLGPDLSHMLQAYKWALEASELKDDKELTESYMPPLAP